MATAVRAVVSVGKFCREQGLLSPADRLSFFSSEDALRLFQPHVCRQQVKSLTRERSRLRNVTASASWFDAAFHHAQQFPPGGVDATAMILSRAKMVSGVTGQASSRWTPPHNVVEEDMIDLMAVSRAARLGATSWPASPSAIAIFRHTHYTKAAVNRFLDNGGREGRGRSTANAKRKQRVC